MKKRFEHPGIIEITIVFVVSMAISLIITLTPTPCKHGSILVKANGGTYGFYGDITICNDGKNGEPIDIELDGYIVDTIPRSDTGQPIIKGQ